MKLSLWASWRRNFVTGLILILPAVATIALLTWLFGTTTKLTDLLLFPVPREWKFINGVDGKIWWYWSLAALIIAAMLVSLVGLLGRYYVGRKVIAAVDSLMLRVPLLNKIYGTLKQVNEAFSSDRRSSFKTVVLVEFPRKGIYSIGFITSALNQEVQARTKGKVVSVFIPTTPNPTSGYLALVPEPELIKLKMSVADGIRFIISLGSVSPPYFPGPDEGAPAPPAAVMDAPVAPTAAPTPPADPSP